MVDKSIYKHFNFYFWDIGYIMLLTIFTFGYFDSMTVSTKFLNLSLNIFM